MILKNNTTHSGQSVQFSYFLLLMFCALLFSSLCRAAPAAITAQTSYEDPIIQITHQAKQGDLTAQVELATAYEHGEGITKNPEKAVKWYCKAAVKGSIDAQRNLAWMFLNARGIEKDEALAVRWFSAAAKSGDQYSRQMLSRLDENLQTKKTVCIVLPTPYWETKKCSKSCQKVVKIVNDIAPGYNMEPRLVLALIQQESNFNIKARSHKGAIGLMQLMPGTAKRFGVKNIWTPEQNIKGGIHYLVWLLKRYQGNVALTLAGYNAGENAVERYKGIPPYKETQNYVKRIMKVYGKSHHPYEKDITMLIK
ncbi:MAG: transglycosylase SLT domain-containing protein [Gammaproteobacteria bacterium]|nr:transglycosylase SLT domain-containing protein [Gammaproteobacteria bacterium]